MWKRDIDRYDNLFVYETGRWRSGGHVMVRDLHLAWWHDTNDVCSNPMIEERKYKKRLSGKNLTLNTNGLIIQTFIKKKTPLISTLSFRDAMGVLCSCQLHKTIVSFIFFGLRYTKSYNAYFIMPCWIIVELMKYTWTYHRHTLKYKYNVDL